MNSVIQDLFFIVVGLFFLFKWTELGEIRTKSSHRPVLERVILGVLLIGGILLSWLPLQDVWIKNVLYVIYLAGLPFLLGRMNCPSKVIQVFLLLQIVLCTPKLDHSLSIFVVCSILLGLLVYGLLKDFLFTTNDNFTDILPSCVWLSSLAWIGLTGRNEANIENILLVCLSISLILKLLPPKFISNDKYFIKRLVLSLCAGLALLIVSKTILLTPNMMILSGLLAGGIFFSYFFENKSSDDEMTNLLISTSFLVILGILTLIGTRLVGDTAIVVLSAACCMNAGKGLFASLFWISRLLIQGFVLTYVNNVTGINLMHPYCSAALFFGFLAILFLSLVLQINYKQSPALASFLILGMLAPPAIIYLIHEEATASFLIASNVVAISLLSFAPLIYNGRNVVKQNNLMLMPLFLSTCVLLFAPLVEIGNHATVASRLQIVSYAIIALIVICFILSNIKRVTRNPV